MLNELYTIGHSTHTIEQFIAMLKAFGITHVIDVRTIPRSRANPQFNEQELAESLKSADIAYTHLAALGGLRHTHKDSINIGWKNASFRGYADYMQTDAFWQGIRELENIARRQTVAIMCAEALPWRCHRSLIADALLTRGWHVRNIQNARIAKEHTLTAFAHVEDGKITYPAP